MEGRGIDGRESESPAGGGKEKKPTCIMFFTIVIYETEIE